MRLNEFFELRELLKNNFSISNVRLNYKLEAFFMVDNESVKMVIARIDRGGDVIHDMDKNEFPKSLQEFNELVYNLTYAIDY